MTGYATARPVIVSIVAGCTGLTKVQGLGDKLIHDASGSERVFTAFRHFWLRVVAGSRRGPATLSATIATYDIVVVVDYPDSDNAAGVDAAILADAEAMVTRLLNQSLWSRPSSGIRCIGAAGDRAVDVPLIPLVVDDVEGGRRLVLSFPVECEVTSV